MRLLAQLVLLLKLACCEIFMFSKVSEILRISEWLEANSINKGFFKAEPGSNMTYRVEVRTKNLRNVLYKADKLEENQETHFSFSNTEPENVIIMITSLPINPEEPTKPGSMQILFESMPDTFNKDVSRKAQIEPAIYGLEQLLKKMNDVISLSRSVSGKLGSLSSENRTMLNFVVFFSFITLGGYIIFNILQVYYMRSYLNSKKFL